MYCIKYWITDQLENIRKNMNLKIVAGIAVLACLGLVDAAVAFNQQDLENLKATGACPRCNLMGADLTRVNLVRANLREANLMGAILFEANLANADLTGANLEGAILNSANLSGASLTGSNLKSASLENADLSAAGFISANLEAANLRGSRIQFTNFRGAHFQLTTLANGVVTSDKSYDWSLDRATVSQCTRFRTANVPGSTCYNSDVAPAQSSVQQ